MADEPTPPPPRKRQSLLGHDLDLLAIYVKRAAALGAVLGFLHHLRCLSH
jgi:hypothetical protein